VGNWKSEENIKHFIENSYEPFAHDFLDKGYDFYVDAFTPLPVFGVNLIKKDENINWILETKSLCCKIIEFESYKEMTSILEEIGKDNYIFLHSVKSFPFQIRLAYTSSENELIGVDRKSRIRDQKLNQLLNE
jgi:hypothetical protein